jgi:transposase
MWVFRGGSRGSPILVYRYAPTRSGTVASDFLAGYSGIIQTDGYSGYKALAEREDIVHAGCWAHARRKFVEVLKGLSNKKRKKGTLAEQAVAAIGKLYDIEHLIRDLPDDQRTLLRQQESLPLLDELHAWLKANSSRVPPKEKLGQAFAYTLNQWDSLVRFATDGRIPIDNNLTENAIRPFVVGRKNWLFSGSPRGASASAFFYSLVETAKACGLEPYAYLRLLFERLPLARTDHDLHGLLPSALAAATRQP